MTTPPSLENVRVLHRTGQWCPGRRLGQVVAYDVRVLPEYQVPGRPTIDRCYLLLDQGVQLTRPVVFEDRTQCATVLSRTQRFIDRHLRATEKGSVDPPHRFPPESIAALEPLPCFLE